MSPIRTLELGTPLSRRLLEALRYPLEGSALATVIVLGSILALADLIPLPLLGPLIRLMVWVSLYLYALSCLQYTAAGWAAPPEISVDHGMAAAITLLVLQTLGLIAIRLANLGLEVAFALPFVLLLVFPALALSLAFGDRVLSALNPARAWHAASTFGPAYFLLVGLVVLQSLIWIETLRSGHGFVVTLLWSLLLVYWVVLTLHMVGRLAYRHHGKLGYEPEADTVVMVSGRDSDKELLARVRSLAAADQTEEAIELLLERIHQTAAPWAIHEQFRRLALNTGRHQDVLETSPYCLARLMQDNDYRRALAVVRQNIELQSDYVPPDPAIAGELARQAANMGMNRLALKLARAYPNTWPRDPDAPRYGLLAAQLLATRLNQPAEATVLAGRLLTAFPDCPQRDELQALLALPDAPALKP